MPCGRGPAVRCPERSYGGAWPFTPMCFGLPTPGAKDPGAEGALPLGFQALPARSSDTGRFRAADGWAVTALARVPGDKRGRQIFLICKGAALRPPFAFQGKTGIISRLWKNIWKGSADMDFNGCKDFLMETAKTLPLAADSPSGFAQNAVAAAERDRGRPGLRHAPHHKGGLVIEVPGREHTKRIGLCAHVTRWGSCAGHHGQGGADDHQDRRPHPAHPGWGVL